MSLETGGEEYFFEGKWRSVKTEGDFEPFLRDRGVPFPIRKMIRLMSNGGKFEFAVKNNCYVETEIGSFSSKVHKAIPLDGKTGIKDKSPAGDEVTKYAKIQDEQLILTNVMADEDDCVDSKVWLEADGSLRKSMTNRKYGSSFTVHMQPLDKKVVRTLKQVSQTKEELQQLPSIERSNNKKFFEGQWRAIKTEGDFEKFLYERGVPFPVRKMIRLMSNGGKFEYAVRNQAYLETEIGRFSKVEHTPIPIGEKLKGVPDKSPAGEHILKYANMPNDQTLILTNAMLKDEDDCVDAQLWLSPDGFLKKQMTNRKYGSSFTITLEPLNPTTSLSTQKRETSTPTQASTAHTRKKNTCANHPPPSSAAIHGVAQTSGGHLSDFFLFISILIFVVWLYRSLFSYLLSCLTAIPLLLFSQVKYGATFLTSHIVTTATNLASTSPSVLND